MSEIVIQCRACPVSIRGRLTASYEVSAEEAAERWPGIAEAWICPECGSVMYEVSAAEAS